MSLPRAVLVTGATGLVGEEVLRRILGKRSDIEAFALVRDDAGWRSLSRKLGPLATRVTPVRGDITMQRLGLEPLVRRRIELQTSAIVHARSEERRVGKECRSR